MPGEICLITSIYPPESGGPAKFCFEFAKWLADLGYPVKVITYSSDRYLDSYPGIKVIAVKTEGNLIVRYLRMSWTIWKNAAGTSSVLVAGAFIETGIASLFHRSQYLSKIPGDIVWERARNNKITDLEIVDFQDSSLPWKYSVFRFLFHQSIKRSSGVIAPSNFINSLVQKWGVEKTKIQTIYNSILIDEQTASMSSAKKYDVLTVARLVPWKGISELIEVCADLNLSLCVVGNGPELQNLSSLANAVNGEVDFLGQIHPSQMQTIYSRSRIFVLNSSYEGLPHVLIEARLAGVMTIAKAGTGSDEVITNGVDGLLVGEAEQLSLKSALLWANAHSDECSELTRNAKTDLRNRFDQEINFRKILNTLTNVSNHAK